MVIGLEKILIAALVIGLMAIGFAGAAEPAPTTSGSVAVDMTIEPNMTINVPTGASLTLPTVASGSTMGEVRGIDFSCNYEGRFYLSAEDTGGLVLPSGAGFKDSDGNQIPLLIKFPFGESYLDILPSPNQPSQDYDPNNYPSQTFGFSQDVGPWPLAGTYNDAITITISPPLLLT